MKQLMSRCNVASHLFAHLCNVSFIICPRVKAYMIKLKRYRESDVAARVSLVSENK